MGEGAWGGLGGRAPRAVTGDRARPGMDLVPVPQRRWVAAVSVLAVACIAAVGFVVRHASRPILFDRWADAALVRSAGFEHRVAMLLSDVGQPRVFVTITAVVALALVLLGDYRAALAAVGSVGLALVVVEEVLKPFFDRRLGSLPGPTFPSGHTAVAMALAGAIGLAARRDRPLGRRLGPGARWPVTVFVLVGAGAIGLAMVALRLHYLTDVMAGVPLGLAIAGCTAVGVDAISGLRRFS